MHCPSLEANHPLGFVSSAGAGWSGGYDLGTNLKMSTENIMLHFSGDPTLAEGLEAQLFSKTNNTKHIDSYKKVWEKAKLQEITGYTSFSPICNKHTYPELVKQQHAARWRAIGFMHLKHIFENGILWSFAQLQSRFGIPSNMLFYYVQLEHTVAAQGSIEPFDFSTTPVFGLMQQFLYKRALFLIAMPYYWGFTFIL